MLERCFGGNDLLAFSGMRQLLFENKGNRVGVCVGLLHFTSLRLNSKTVSDSEF